MSEVVEISFLLTEEAIEQHLANIRAIGVAEVAVNKYRTPLKDLYLWLGEYKLVTAARLVEWRKDVEARGYADKTKWTYIGKVNTFLRANGYESICIPKPTRKDLTGQTFGYLTAIEPVGKDNRRNIIWRCKCKCGNEIDVVATLLVAMNTTSCGCLKGEQFKYINRHVDGTHLTQVLKDDTLSSRSASGYTGVYFRNGKWIARIMYKGKLYSLGSYSKVEDAARARARAKDIIMDDARALYEETDHLFQILPTRPPKPTKVPSLIIKSETEPKTKAKRTDNTSGHTGVFLRKGKWMASIAYKGIRYVLGYHEYIDDAIAIRKLAEQLVATENLEELKKIITRCHAC